MEIKDRTKPPGGLCKKRKAERIELQRRKVEFICKTVAAPYHVAGSLLTIGTSCGFALYPEEGTDTVKITRLADQRMYKHKQKNHALQDHGLYG